MSLTIHVARDRETAQPRGTYTDSHCHLSAPPYADDYPAVLARARAAGVGCLINISSDVANAREVLRQAEACEWMWATVGVHPHEATTWNEATLEELRELAKHPKVVAVGEIGADFHYNFSPPEQQEKIFRQSIRLARELRLPIIVHNREADEAVLRVFREEGASEVGGVVHCFTSDVAMARACLDLGFDIGFTGIITYPKAADLLEVLRFVPMDRLLIETDGPYLAPVPHRGKRNEPAFVRHVAEKVAEVRGLGVTAVAKATAANAKRLFGVK